MPTIARATAWLACAIGLIAVSATAAGCGADSNASSEDELTDEVADAISVDPMRSLILTNAQDAATLSRFPLKRVLQQIITRMPGVSPVTPEQLYAQMFDTLNSSDHAQTSGPHCTGKINGFASECPRTEGILAAIDPFAAPTGTFDDRYKPTAIVNRFDLASTTGKDCGEYRIVYAKGTTGAVDRNFLIFEGRLPNPTPGLALKGCLPVAQLWANLSTTSDATQRADVLENFYFNGLTAGTVSFEPVVDPTHYGMTSTFTAGASSRGQIRANLFLPFGRPYFAGGTQPPGGEFWQLREFQTRRICNTKTGVCSLQIRNETSKNNPDGSLFAPNPAPGSKAESFQTTDFLAMVPKLAKPAASSHDAALIGMKTTDKYNSGESSSDGRQNYLALAAGNTVFKSAITAKLAAIGRSDLTADQILNRATSQSCGGCHQVSNGVDMGGGITFPSSNGFTQIDESGNLSAALTQVFLPHRKAVLEAFVNAPVATAASAAASDLQTVGGDGLN